MSFDQRSLDRLRELGRQLPQKLPDPKPASSGSGVEPGSHMSRNHRGPQLHKVETEQDPEALFRELMSASEDGTVPDHLMSRLKQLEAQRQPSGRPSIQEPISATDLPAPARVSGRVNGKNTRPSRPNVTPGSEEESLYVAFGQLLLEDDEESD